METLLSLHESLVSNYGPGIYIPIAAFLFIGILGQWMLYYKCDLPGVACIVPIWNVVVFLKIMGRPAWHMIYFLIPIYNIYFIIQVYTELCDSFGRNTTKDYLLCLIFNGFYVLYLGLSDNTVYYGPVYGKTAEELIEMKVGMA